MSLRLLKAALSQAEFRPLTFSSGTSALDFVSLLSSEALSFLKNYPAPLESGFISSDEWDPKTISDFRSLDPEVRLEILGFLGFEVHELTHKMDFILTPFGVSYFGRACLETIGLLTDAPQLITDLERHNPYGSLLESLSAQRGLISTDGVDAMANRIRWFDALRGSSPRYLKPGWYRHNRPIKLGNAGLNPVMIHELLFTILLPGRTDLYLRPQTILEGRALAISSLHLLSQLGPGDWANEEVSRFVQTFYESQAHPDYTFLLNLNAGLWGEETLSRLLRSESRDTIVAAMNLLIASGWYALHATPQINPNSNVNSNSVARYMFVLNALARGSHESGSPTSAVEFFDEYDVSEEGVRIGLTNPRDTLQYCSSYLDTVISTNRDKNPNSTLREHFDTLLRRQRTHIGDRVEVGYLSQLGMPDRGLLFGYSTVETVKQRSLTDDLETSKASQEWFSLRENLLFRHARRPGFWDRVWTYVCNTNEPSPAISFLDRDHAMSESRSRLEMLKGGTWPDDSVVIPSAPGEPICRANTGTLTRTFERFVRREPDEVETRWQFMTSRTDFWLALDVKFSATGESLRLLFTSSTRTHIVRRILGVRRLSMVTEEQAFEISQGRFPSAVLTFPVTCDPTFAETFLKIYPMPLLESDELGWNYECSPIIPNGRIETRFVDPSDIAHTEVGRAFAENVGSAITGAYRSAFVRLIPVSDTRGPALILLWGDPESIKEFWREARIGLESIALLDRVAAIEHLRLFQGLLYTVDPLTAYTVYETQNSTTLWPEPTSDPRNPISHYSKGAARSIERSSALEIPLLQDGSSSRSL